MYYLVDIIDSTIALYSILYSLASGLLCLSLQQISDLLFRPPPLRFDGLNKIWSFLFPVFNLSDGDLFKTGGLDSLVRAT